MKRALSSGVIGAGAVTILNHMGKRFLPHAPRLDVLGMRLFSKLFNKANIAPPKGKALFGLSLIGEMISNSAFYGLIGMGNPKNAWVRGGLLGLAAGVGATALPEPMNLGKRPTARRKSTVVVTIAWYVLGGLLAALAYRKMRPSQPRLAAPRAT
jgi:hypothetical protein